MEELYSPWEKVFAEEYEVPESEAQNRIDGWLDEFATHDTFEEFYDDVVRGAEKDVFTPGKNSAYSVRHADEGPLNCEGEAFITALAGEERYGKEFELQVEQNLDNNPHLQGPPQLISHHVTAIDEEGEVYGGEQGWNHSRTISGDEIAALYFLSMGRDEQARGNENRAEELFDRVKMEKSTSQYIGRRLQDWGQDTARTPP